MPRFLFTTLFLSLALAGCPDSHDDGDGGALDTGGSVDTGAVADGGALDSPTPSDAPTPLDTATPVDGGSSTPTKRSSAAYTSRHSTRRKMSVRINTCPPVRSAPLESATFDRKSFLRQPRTTRAGKSIRGLRISL